MKKHIINLLKIRRIESLFFFILGSLTALAFAPYYLIFIPFITIALLFKKIDAAPSRKDIFLKVFAFGFGLGGFSTSWIANALMIDGGQFAYLIPLAFIGMGILFGLFYAIPAILSTFYPSGIRRLLAFAALFTIFEWVRSWFLTGFPWNLLGSVWENTLPILQSASVWGVYGLSFLTVFICGSLSFLPRKRTLTFAGVLLLCLYIAGFGRLYTATNATIWGIKLRLVQPNIAQTLKWDPNEAENSFSKIMRLSRQNNEGITHVIWPESAVPFIVNQNDDERPRLMQAVQQGGTLILGGLRADENQRNYANSLFVLDDFANIRAHYDKSHLVPFGEYVPLRDLIPIDKVVPLPFDFIEGSGIQTIDVQKTPPFSPLVCYEVIFSGRVARKDKRPDWLVNVTNDGWYGISAGPYQHLGMAKMRAVEEGLSLARAANTGISAVFDGYGRVVGQTKLGTEDVLDTVLPEPLSQPLYSRFGIWIPVGFSFLLLLFLRFRRK